MMFRFYFLLFFLVLTSSVSSASLFSIQDSLTILCNQFPLVPLFNNSNVQCARLRIDETVPSANFDLDKPSQLILFIIINVTSTNADPLDITIQFNQSSDSPSSIYEIRLAILVTQTNFTINKNSIKTYAPYDVPIYQWQNSTDILYNPIDIIQISDQTFDNDRILCTWSSNQWNKLLLQKGSNNVPYVYFLQTTNHELIFNLIDTRNKSSLSLPPFPYLDILYCIPYTFGAIEVGLLIAFCVLSISIGLMIIVLHHIKRDDDIRCRPTEQLNDQKGKKKSIRKQSQLRHRSNPALVMDETGYQISA